MSGVLDEAALQNTLEIVGDDLEFLADLIASFRDDGAQTIDEMRSSLGTGSTERLQRAAHTLKGTSASFGAVDLTQSCRDLEAAGRVGGLDGAGDQIEAIAAEFEAVIDALDAWMGRRSGGSVE